LKSRGWIQKDGPTYTYTYERLITQCRRIILKFVTNFPSGNAVIQLPLTESLDGPDWSIEEEQEFADQPDFSGCLLV
jgi:hypothetical protein